MQFAFWAGLFVVAGGANDGGFMSQLLASLDPNRHFLVSLFAGAAQVLKAPDLTHSPCELPMCMPT